MKRIPITALLCCLAATLTFSRPSLHFEELGRGLVYPVVITHSGDGSGRLFILELEGRIRIFQDGQLLERPFLDITSRVLQEGEAGLVGLAFHPDFAGNRRFFVYYVTQADGTLKSVVSEFKASASDPDESETEERVLLDFTRPTTTHNGGDLAFGPDGYLYITSGDGGDPSQAQQAQAPGSLLGKILRIDVDKTEPYAIPVDNPFVSDSKYRPEIWALGFRNPWRFGFDRRTGELFVGDVGSNRAEEVNIVKRGGNYGWPIAEGYECRSPQMCNVEQFQAPILAFGRSPGGAAVVGGPVYRGSSPALYGWYLASDFVTKQIWGLRDGPRGWTAVEIARPDFRVGDFGEDEAGEIYTLDFSAGIIYRIVPLIRFDFAQVAAGRYPGGDLRAELILSNPWEDRVEVWLKTFSPDARPLAFQIEGNEHSSFHMELAPGSSRSLPLEVEEGLSEGWLSLEAEREVGSTLRLEARDSENRLQASLGAEPSVRTCEFVVEGRRDESAGISQGIAVANPLDGNPVQVTVELLDESGDLAGAQEFPLASHEQRAQLLDSILPPSENFTGTIRIHSSRPVVVTVLRTRSGLAQESVRGGGFCDVP